MSAPAPLPHRSRSSGRPWTPERELSAERAGALLTEAFPRFAGARIELLGVGWDNTAFLVDGAWVFRFPRREIASRLIELESRLLPALAPHLPLPIPRPVFVGRPSPAFPWPFSGYARLEGRTACAHAFGEDGRAACARPLALFLRALHAVPEDFAARHGAAPDTLGRLDLERRRPRIEASLAAARDGGWIDAAGPWLGILDEAPASWRAGDATLVHGDFDSRHLLVDGRGQPTGVIDWGDAHLGDAAVDLSIAHGSLPPASRDVFREAYGEIDESAWLAARVRALQSAVTILCYGEESGDAVLAREGRRALANLIADG